MYTAEIIIFVIIGILGGTFVTLAVHNIRNCRKQEKDYQVMMKNLNCKPEKMVMIGNSFKSDILPVVKLGGYGIYIPYHTTWAHEVVDKIEHPRIVEVERMGELKKALTNLEIEI